jgi:predicted acyltransferase
MNKIMTAQKHTKNDIHTVTPKSSRLVSLDAIRGFDMLWIMGGERIIFALRDLTGLAIFAQAANQMGHAVWNGFHFYDLIFPLFLFVAGVSLPFSMEKRKANGERKSKIYRHIFVRMITLVIFGIIFNSLYELRWSDIQEGGWDHIRYASVLGRIGLGWFFAALIVLNSNPKWWYAWFGGILLFYWAILALIPVPGYGAGNLTMAGSLVGYIDRLLLPGHLYNEIHDPEGILSNIPAISTALMGAITGNFLRMPDQRISGQRKALWMVLIGIVSLGTGWLWGLVFPINKNLWTSSFVLYAGGWSLVLLAVFYLVIDVWGWKKWAFFFVVIGLNSITIYMFQAVISRLFFIIKAALFRFNDSTIFVFGGIIKSFAGDWLPLINAVGYTTFCWVFLYLLYRKRIFLKI